ncbi:unnamed protein product [Fraxinus pennsylvanica]|uniref:Vacuolar iron transporter n=1 Tax=Fraxinus pennsylvanica TaxID=56036 RepID=A0AAD2AHK3_9LAMI|nr:unnamed protein product [Fraxinus pennsylvanica]
MQKLLRLKRYHQNMGFSNMNKCWPVANALRKNPRAWLDFMMKNICWHCLPQHNLEHILLSGLNFELVLEKPNPKRALQSAFTIAIAYIVGGVVPLVLVPLVPYIFIPVARKAVIASVVLTLMALLIFGYAKGHFTGNKPIRSALQTALIRAIASAAAFGMAKA